MRHLFYKGTNQQTLILLHGTGGSEEDLIPLAQKIDPNANIFSIRGNVSENGLLRFFKRIAPGVYDKQDLLKRTVELNEFLIRSAKHYKFTLNNAVIVGYSNGANIALSLLFNNPFTIDKYILFSPLMPKEYLSIKNFTNKNIFISVGDNDPLVDNQATSDLFNYLQSSFARVELFRHSKGHSIPSEALTKSKDWYEKVI